MKNGRKREMKINIFLILGGQFPLRLHRPAGQRPCHREVQVQVSPRQAGHPGEEAGQTKPKQKQFKTNLCSDEGAAGGEL